MIMIMVVI